MRAILIALAMALPAFPAWADRHCGPVLDAYYDARLVALDTETSCSAAMEAATQQIEAAMTNARICGCTPLIDALDSVFATALKPNAACENRRSAVLDDALDARLKALVADCH
jgi:hypothetical protein